MDLQALLDNANESLSNALFDLELLEIQLSDKRDEIQRLRDEIAGLRLSAERLGLLADEDVDDDNVVPIHGRGTIGHNDLPDLAGLNRTEAVAEILELEGRAIDRTKIFDLALMAGADFEAADQVSLALTNLKRSGRVEKLGDGRWRLIAQRKTKP